MNIDIKDNLPQAVDRVIDIVDAAGRKADTVLASFHDRVLSRVRRVEPEINTSAGPGDLKRMYWRYTIRRMPAVKPAADIFQIPMRYGPLKFTSRRFIRFVQTAGCRINFWTVNDEHQIRAMLDRGVNGIVTDRPDLARRIYDEYGFIARQ